MITNHPVTIHQRSINGRTFGRSRCRACGRSIGLLDDRSFGQVGVRQTVGCTIKRMGIWAVGCLQVRCQSVGRTDSQSHNQRQHFRSVDTLHKFCHQRAVCTNIDYFTHIQRRGQVTRESMHMHMHACIHARMKTRARACMPGCMRACI